MTLNWKKKLCDNHFDAFGSIKNISTNYFFSVNINEKMSKVFICYCRKKLFDQKLNYFFIYLTYVYIGMGTCRFVRISTYNTHIGIK